MTEEPQRLTVETSCEVFAEAVIDGRQSGVCVCVSIGVVGVSKDAGVGVVVGYVCMLSSSDQVEG